MIALMQALVRVVPHFRTFYAVELGTCQCENPDCNRTVAGVLPGKPPEDFDKPVIQVKFLAFMGKAYFAKTSRL